MTVPANTVYRNGAVPVTGDQFNTFIQTVLSVATLRTFVGTANMQIGLLGLITPGDGGAGIFWWNPASTASDDGVNVIVPSAAGSGAWNRLGIGTDTFVVTTIAALEAVTDITVPGNYVYVLGYYAAGDGGEGNFYVGATATANGGTIVNDASGRSWYRETNSLPYSLEWFGAKGDGTTDNTTSVRAWLASGGKAFWVPAGTFAFSTATLPVQCAMTGAGQGIATLRGLTASSTMLSYAGGSLTATGISFGGMGFDGGAAGITALSATFANGFTVDDCLFTGIAHPVTCDRCYFPTIRNSMVRGNASFAGGQVSITDTTGVGLSAGGYITRVDHDCSANNGIGGSQVTPLILINDVAQVSVTRCLGFDLASVAPNTIGHIEVRGLCQGIIIDQNSSIGSSVGILVRPALSGSNSPSFIDISGNLIDSFGTAGVQLLGTAVLNLNLINIRGGLITAPEGPAVPCIDAHYTGATNTIVGVQFYQWMGFPTPSGVGIQLFHAFGFTIADCGFGQLTTPINFVGTNNQIITIADCVTQGCTNSLVGTTPTGSRLTNNSWNPNPTPAMPSLPASTVTYANDTGYNLLISVSGGTVTNIALNNSATGLTSGAFFLPPGGSNSIALTYSVAPNWTVSVEL